jgi:RNA polymerase sigma-70 factor (ECF subfamily)
MMRDAVAASHPTFSGQMPTDADLVVEAQADPRAFAALYERYRDRIYWYLLTRTNSVEDADDLLQLVFLKALDALGQYRPARGPFAAWLFGIARHTTATFQARRRPTVAWDLVPEVLLPVDEHDLEAQLVRREDLGRLRRCFGRLEAHRREVLILRFVTGLSIAEIAAVIGKSEAATKKQLARTLQALKEHYDDPI